MSENRIQRVELNHAYDSPIHCPFCGACVVDTEAAADGGEATNPCPHTLFICHDEGFEYRSQRFDENLGLVGVDDDEVEVPEKGYDGLTDTVTITDSIKIAAYVPAPSFFGSYVGFAPAE